MKTTGFEQQVHKQPTNLLDPVLVVYLVLEERGVAEGAHDERLQQVVRLLLVLRGEGQVSLVRLVVGGSSEQAGRVVGVRGVAGVEAERARSQTARLACD